MRANRVFEEGEIGAQLISDICIMPEDTILSKSIIDTFLSTYLDKILKEKGISTFALAGLLTDVCISSTMRHGYDLGYKIYTITDCMGTFDPNKHGYFVENELINYSIPVKAADFLSLQ